MSGGYGRLWATHPSQNHDGGGLREGGHEARIGYYLIVIQSGIAL
jgi:hypothetical protein